MTDLHDHSPFILEMKNLGDWQVFITGNFCGLCLKGGVITNVLEITEIFSNNKTTACFNELKCLDV
jgi:hypothetical protein